MYKVTVRDPDDGSEEVYLLGPEHEDREGLWALPMFHDSWFEVDQESDAVRLAWSDGTYVWSEKGRVGSPVPFKDGAWLVTISRS